MSDNTVGTGRNGMALGQWLPLIGLTFSAFVLNTSEFMPIGLLTDIAGSFGITEATAGIMITAYAWAVMLLSLPLMIAASRIGFKRLLIGVLGVFALGQILSAVAPGFAVLTLARIVVASAHAIFWSIASIMASRLVDTKHGPLALSMVATGTSIAMIFGLPIGRSIGLMVGWRMTFALVGAIALVIAGYMAAVCPKMAAGDAFSVRQLPDLLRNRVLVTMYVITVLFAAAYYTGYSYIEPFLQQVGGMAPDLITMVLTVFGFAGLLGSLAFSRFYDGHRRSFLGLTIAGVSAALLLLHAASAGAGLVAVVADCALWGMCATAWNVAFQSEVIRAARADTSAVAMSIFSGLFNFGIGAGSALGGIVVTHLSIGAIGYVGGAIGAVGLILTVTVLFGLLRRPRAGA